jgi:hypothetical protein
MLDFLIELCPWHNLLFVLSVLTVLTSAPIAFMFSGLIARFVYHKYCLHISYVPNGNIL